MTVDWIEIGLAVAAVVVVLLREFGRAELANALRAVLDALDDEDPDNSPEAVRKRARSSSSAKVLK